MSVKPSLSMFPHMVLVFCPPLIYVVFLVVILALCDFISLVLDSCKILLVIIFKIIYFKLIDNCFVILV